MLFIKSQEAPEAYELLREVLGDKTILELVDDHSLEESLGISSIANPWGAATKDVFFVPYEEGLIIQKRDTDKTVWFKTLGE